MTIKLLNKSPILVRGYKGSTVSDDMLLAPELLVPGEKPVGQVEVNWEHPLLQSNKLVASYLPMPIYGNTLRDLCGNADAALYSAASIGVEGFLTPGVDNSTSQGATTGQSTGVLDFVNGYSIIAKIKIVTAGSFNTILAKRDSSNYQYQIRMANGNKLNVLHTAGSVAASVTLDLNVWHVIAVTYTAGAGADSLKLYSDGTWNGSSDKLITHRSIDATIGTTKNTTSIDHSLGGYIEYMHIFSNQVSPDNIELIAGNPYQFYMAI